MTAPDALAPWRDDPGRAGVFSDFDGTLAEIVDDPASARPAPGVVDLLSRLADRLGRVGILSGRPVAFLARHLPDDRLMLGGLYGLEMRRDGHFYDHPEADHWRGVIADVVAMGAVTIPPGARLENKGLSLTVHYRGHVELEQPVLAWARRQAQFTRLSVRVARRSVELHPPLPLDKGTLLEQSAGSLGAVLFAGDDRGDLAAFDALDRLAQGGCHTLRIGVESDEAPSALVERADLVVAGPAGLVELLSTLGA